jgi:Bacterial Ig-like domain (group 2)
VLHGRFRKLIWLLAVVGSTASLGFANSKLTISPSNPKQLKNSSVRFSASINGKPVDGPVTWSSSNPAVATITGTSGAANATLLSAGTTTITAEHSGQTASTTLTVTIAVNPVFTAQPTDTNVSAVIGAGTGVRAQLLDNLGGPLAGQTITMAIGTNGAQSNTPPATGVLSGTLSQITDVTGTATFPDLRIDWLGSGYTLIAAANPISGAVAGTSAAFNELRVGDPCLGPNPACSSGCPDADGDGLNDAWEIAGGIDYNGDGKIDAQHDLLLPGADPHKPDIYVQYDWMGYGGTDSACTVDSDCTLWGSGHAGETCTGPAVIPTASGSCRYACTTDSDCTSRSPRPLSHVGERCIASSCVHTHDPEVEQPGAIQAVIDRFAARGFNLHVLRGSALPHSHVLSFRLANQMTDDCEGGSVASGTAGAGKYVDSFYDLKAASFDPKRNPVYHYSIFAHYNSCDSPTHCSACPATGKIPTPPGFGVSGLAEIDGNDFMVSLGNVVNDRSVRPTIFNLGGTFMHELGHNLGLRHGGGSDFNGDAEDTPTFKPNFISVMNYHFQLVGIQQADTIGSIMPDPALTRLDYSTQTLPVGGNTPGALTEGGPGLNEPAGLGSGTADLTAFDDGACNFGFQPTNGPLDFDGDGNTTGTNVSVDLNRQDHPLVMGCPSGVTETLNGHTDWGPALGQSIFTYKFQCTPFYSDDRSQGAGTAAPKNQATGSSPAQSWTQEELTPEMAAQAHALYPVKIVKIVFRPGCLNKAVAPGQAGVVGVSVLSDAEADFDVSEIEPASLRLHGARAISVSTRDVEGSGKPGLYATFDMKDLKMHPNAATVRLTGWLKNSQFFIGEDLITVVPTMSLADTNCH